jgi:DnaJ-class molecular chaperone
MKYEEIDKARKTLELGEKATMEQIKKAYRRLSKKWHPDACGEKDKDLCREKMAEISGAYKIIMKYVKDYSFSFSEETVIEESPEERWKKQFGKDPLWGPGWE